MQGLSGRFTLLLKRIQANKIKVWKNLFGLPKESGMNKNNYFKTNQYIQAVTNNGRKTIFRTPFRQKTVMTVFPCRRTHHLLMFIQKLFCPLFVEVNAFAWLPRCRVAFGNLFFTLCRQADIKSCLLRHHKNDQPELIQIRDKVITNQNLIEKFNI